MNNKLIIITNRTCNNRCSHCNPSNWEDQSYRKINIGEMKKIISDFVSVDEVWLFGGEPTLHKDFFSFGKIIQKSNKQFGLITNGWFLENRISAINFFKRLFSHSIKSINIYLSIDSFHHEEYKKRHNQISLEKYANKIMKNLELAKDLIKINKLELGWVYSNKPTHKCPRNIKHNFEKVIFNYKERGIINKGTLVMDPLHFNQESQIKYSNETYLKKIPSKSKCNFDSCNPYYVAFRSTEGTIVYSYCIYVCEQTIFGTIRSNFIANNSTFISRYPFLPSIANKNKGVYNFFRKFDKSPDYGKYLNQYQMLYSSNRACPLCSYELKRCIK